MVSSAAAAYTPIVMMNIVDNIIVGKNCNGLLRWVIFYIFIIFIQVCARLISEYNFTLVGSRMIFDFKLKLIKHLLSSRELHKKGTEVLTVIDEEVCYTEGISSKAIFSTASHMTTSILMLVVLLSVRWELVIGLIVLQGLAIFSKVTLNRRIIDSSLIMRDITGEVARLQRRFIDSKNSVLSGGETLYKDFIAQQRQYVKQNIKLNVLSSCEPSSTDLLKLSSFALIFVYGSYKVSVGTMTIGELIAFIYCSQQLFVSVTGLACPNLTIRQFVGNANRIFTVLDEPKAS